MSKFEVISYGAQLRHLNLKLFNEKRWLYESMKVSILLKELQEKGFKASRWNKPTKKGTNVRFVAVKSPEEYDNQILALRDYVEGINKSLGCNFIFNVFKSENETSTEKGVEFEV